MKKFIAMICLIVVLAAGCDSLRFAPGEAQKQNAWLHGRTTLLAAELARSEGASGPLTNLTALSEIQSRAFCADYGLPAEFPQADNPQEILTSANRQLAGTALSQASRRPDAWDVADGAMDLGIAAVALFGGVYGVRAAGFLRQVRTKSKALREIIKGNEIFKRQNAEVGESFNAAHQLQSAQTRQLVTQIKHTS